MIKRLAAFALLLLLAAPARADLVDTVLDVLVTAGVIDPVFKESKSVVQCVVNSGSFNETVATKCIQEAAKAQAQALVPNDPKLKVIVDTALAVKGGEWLKVLELVGTDGARTIVCSGVISVGGAVKDLFCGAVFNAAKPVIKSALNAVLKGDWWGLVTLLGPQMACQVIPGGAVKDAVCGPLATMLGGVKAIAEDAVGVLKTGVDFVIETWKNEDSPMPLAKYYEIWYVPMYHCGVWLQTVPKEKNSNAYYWCSQKTKGLYGNCVTYFDNHQMSNGDAKKVCNQMQASFNQHVAQVAAALKQAPDAYYNAKVAPRLFELYLYSQKNSWQSVHNYVHYPCRLDLQALYPAPQGDTVESRPEPSVWFHACSQVTDRLKKGLDAQKPMLAQKLAQLAALDCHPANTYNKLPVNCGSYPGLKACMSELSAATTEACVLDQSKADKALGAQLVQQLGTKRCQTMPSLKGEVRVGCTRPWKVDQCKTYVAQHTAQTGFKSKVGCTALLSGFTPLVKQAQDILFTLNGGVKQPTGMKTDEGGLAVFLPPTGQNCTTLWDPLAITCSKPSALAKLKTPLPGCKPDPNKDGADAPCYGGPLSASDAAKKELAAGAKTALSPGGTAPSRGQPAGRTTAPAGGGFVAAPPAAGSTAAPPAIAKAQVPALAKPDLAVTLATATINRSCIASQPVVRVRVNLQNSGDAAVGPTRGGAGLRVRTVSGRPLNATADLPALAPGQSHQAEIAVHYAGPLTELAGTHVLEVHANPDHAVAESDYGNNMRRLQVQFPAGFCGDTAAPRAGTRAVPVSPPGARSSGR